MTTISSTLRALDRVAPALAAETAYALWITPGRRIPVHPAERAVMEDARTAFRTVRGKRVATYEWGGGPRTVLLVHGWQSRASAFAPLVRELRQTGRRIVAFDAPGNGRSSGRRTDIRDYAAIIAELEPASGFEAIVAHSMGAPAAAVAIREGVRAERLVTINGAADFEYLLAQFGRRLGLTGRMLRGVRARTERRLFRDTPDVWRRYSAAGVALPADLPWLLIHDEDDAVIEVSQAHALLAENPGARPLFTKALGHNRPLRDDAVLDAVAGFLGTPAP